VTSSWFFLSTL